MSVASYTIQTPMKLPDHVKAEAELFAHQWVIFMQKIPAKSKKFEKNWLKAIEMYVNEWMEGQLGR